MNQTLEQKRASHAWEAVQTFVKRIRNKGGSKDDAKKNEEAAKKYGTHVRKLPTRIVASGLGQALAFLVAKDYCPDLLRALNHWILFREPFPVNNPKRLPAEDALLREVIHGDSDYLRLKTAEALAYLQWLSRFAEAERLTDNLTED